MSHLHHPIERRSFLLGAAALGVSAAYVASGGAASASTAGARTGTALLTRSVGSLDVIALYDASGPFFATRTQAFPNATAEQWARARRFDPDAFGPDDAWNLDFRCYAIRRPGGRVVLVDTGVGRENSPAAAWAPVPGRLPAALRAAGIAPEDVDVVVLTHLHEDHIGWSVGPDGTPAFANARYVVQHDELAALTAAGDETILRYAVDPLRGTGQLHEVRGRVPLLGGVRNARGRTGDTITVVPTPGHTPGHQSVLVDGDRRQIVITGDVLVHAVQLVAPDVGYLFEGDQEVARRTREALLASARAHRAVLATPHLKQPFIAAEAARS